MAVWVAVADRLRLPVPANTPALMTLETAAALRLAEGATVPDAEPTARVARLRFAAPVIVPAPESVTDAAAAPSKASVIRRSSAVSVTR